MWWTIKVKFQMTDEDRVILGNIRTLCIYHIFMPPHQMMPGAYSFSVFRTNIRPVRMCVRTYIYLYVRDPVRLRLRHLYQVEFCSFIVKYLTAGASVYCGHISRLPSFNRSGILGNIGTLYLYCFFFYFLLLTNQEQSLWDISNRMLPESNIHSFLVKKKRFI